MLHEIVSIMKSCWVYTDQLAVDYPKHREAASAYADYKLRSLVKETATDFEMARAELNALLLLAQKGQPAPADV